MSDPKGRIVGFNLLTNPFTTTHDRSIERSQNDGSDEKKKKTKRNKARFASANEGIWRSVFLYFFLRSFRSHVGNDVGVSSREPLVEGRARARVREGLDAFLCSDECDLR